jgi:hypothetical protein
MKKWILVTLLMGSVATAACEDKGGAPATDGAPSSSAANKKPKEQEAPKSLTVEQFTADAPVAACKTLASCKNEEVTISIGAMLMMMAGFATLEDPAASKELEAISAAMKKEGRNTINGDECNKIMGAVTKSTGFNAETIQASIDAKKTEFNGEKAAACYAALSTQPSFCKDEKKVAGDPKLGELDRMMKAYEKELDAHTKACDETFVGKLAAGSACEHDFECAGEKVECKQKKCAKKAG